MCYQPVIAKRCLKSEHSCSLNVFNILTGINLAIWHTVYTVIFNKIMKNCNISSFLLAKEYKVISEIKCRCNNEYAYFTTCFITMLVKHP